MKNRILLILLLFAGITIFNSCDENKLLNKHPLDAPNAGNFFINATSARQAAGSVLGIMTQIPWDFRRYWWTRMDIFSDDSYTRNVADRTPGLQWTADATWYGYYSWWYCFYKGINNANFAIDGIPTSTDLTFTPDKQAPYIAVAKMEKAFCFLQLTNFWGDVPYSEHFVSVVDSMFASRTAKADVMTHVIADLQYATTNLPHSWSGGDQGFPTKAAAAAMLAKAYLYNRDFANAATAAAAALAIADADGYAMMSDYTYMMSYDSQTAGANTEFIWYFPFIENGSATGTQNEMNVERLVRDSPGPVGAIYGAGWGYALPSQNLYNEFEPGDPRRVQSMYAPGDFYAIYNGDQVPADNTFVIPNNKPATGQPAPAFLYPADSTYTIGSKIYYRALWSYSNTNTRKMVEHDYKDGVLLEIDEQQAGYDVPLVRYADLVLMYAEALIESNQVALGIAQINRVRARPSTHMPPISAGLSQNDARKALRHERRIELNMEGLRLADMFRWTRDDGQSGTVPGTTPGSYLEQIFGSGLNGKPILMRLGDPTQLKGQALTFPKHLLFPIPQDEVDRNKNMKQNPGW